jgi:hypothetical protein
MEMKAKLKKESDGDYILILNNPKEYPFPLPLLSFKNCQAIERGYDLDELGDEKYPIQNTGTMFMPNTHEVNNVFRQEGFKAGFQKALELMGDKKYSEEDVRNAYFNGEKDSYVKGGQTKEMQDEFIQSLQQTEWDVEIEMECPQCQEWGYISECRNNCNKKFLKPKLDADGCLILKIVLNEN